MPNRKNGLDQLSSMIAFCISANWGPFATLTQEAKNRFHRCSAVPGCSNDDGDEMDGGGGH